MSKDGYYGDFDNFSEEQRAFEIWEDHQREQSEPNVVPCFKCMGMMYEINNNPEENICDNCKPKDREIIEKELK